MNLALNAYFFTWHSEHFIWSPVWITHISLLNNVTVGRSCYRPCYLVATHGCPVLLLDIAQVLDRISYPGFLWKLKSLKPCNVPYSQVLFLLTDSSVLLKTGRIILLFYSLWVAGVSLSCSIHSILPRASITS